MRVEHAADAFQLFEPFRAGAQDLRDAELESHHVAGRRSIGFETKDSSGPIEQTEDHLLGPGRGGALKIDLGDRPAFDQDAAEVPPRGFRLRRPGLQGALVDATVGEQIRPEREARLAGRAGDDAALRKVDPANRGLMTDAKRSGLPGLGDPPKKVGACQHVERRLQTAHSCISGCVRNIGSGPARRNRRLGLRPTPAVPSELTALSPESILIPNRGSRCVQWTGRP